jgi:hypothetical protein
MPCFSDFSKPKGIPYLNTRHEISQFVESIFEHYSWPTRSVIRTTRQAVLQQIAQHPAHPNTPLQVLIDLTSLEKCGKFLQLLTRQGLRLHIPRRHKR